MNFGWGEIWEATAKTAVVMLSLAVLSGVVLAVAVGTFAALLWLVGALPQ